LLQQPTPVFEKGFTEAQFYGFQIADPLLVPLLANQTQEGSGFPELLGGDFRGLEFFLLSAVAASN
jgi:hypothetical protein